MNLKYGNAEPVKNLFDAQRIKFEYLRRKLADLSEENLQLTVTIAGLRKTLELAFALASRKLISPTLSLAES